MYTTTLAQFKVRVWQEFKASYPDATREDFNYSYNQQEFYDMWMTEIAQDKNPATPILNRMWNLRRSDNQFWLFVRFNDIVLPAGWLNPGSIEWNKQNSIKVKKG